MATASAPKPSNAAGSSTATAVQSPLAQPSQNKPSNASTPGQADHANAHSTAQLSPAQATASTTPTSAANGGTAPSYSTSYAGLPQPDSDFGGQQLPGQPYKDGRIRNPVPSKLKGKPVEDPRQFGVMHMDLKNKDRALERELAAKRTSENTQLAAKLAYKNGYVAHRRAPFIPVPPDLPPGQPFTGDIPYDRKLAGVDPNAPPKPPKSDKSVIYSRPLTSAETKEEQARLLTLLRTLQPVAVVDQICKALAYFGGIPGAPPPQDSKFPESAESNGSGSLFVGWIAEIFPDLDANGNRKPRAGRSAPDEAGADKHGEKRPRGRPKGSKASHSRSDKGIKKGPKKTSLALGAARPNNAEHDGSWVDMDDSVMDAEQDAAITDEQSRSTPNRQAAGHVDLTGSGKKRGRPKGSKNRPKDAVGGEDHFGTPMPVVQSALFSIGKKKGRPKGSKNRPKESEEAGSSQPATNGAITAAEPASTSLQAAAIPDGTEYALAALRQFNESTENETSTQAQSSSFQPVNAAAVNAPQQTAAPASNTQTNISPQAVKKRKRKSAAKDGEAGQASAAGGAAVTQAATASGSSTQPVANGTQGAAMVALTSTPAPPAPKRQRKAKDPNSATKKKAGGASNTPTAGTAQVSQTSIPPAPAARDTTQDYTRLTSPTIEELEAELDPPLEHSYEQDLRSSEVTPATHPVHPVSQSQVSHPPQPQLQQSQQSQTQQRNEQRQAMLARQRQQHQQQQYQQQQHAVARTASPSVNQANQANSASPHPSVQSGSPNISQVPLVSPNMSTQRASTVQTSNSVTPQPQQQPQSRNSQSYYSNQSRSTQSQYGQQHQQQQQQAQQQYSNQPQKQQQTYANQQQQPQYSSQKQQAYPSQQQPQYSPQTQQYSSQQRMPQQYASTTTTGTTSQTLASQSPQFGTSSSTSYNSGDGSFRTSSSNNMNFNSSSFGSNQTSSAPRTHNAYQTSNSYNTPTRQTPSFNTRTPLPSSNSHHNSVPNSLQQNMQSFSNFSDLSQFDMSSLDSSGAGHGSLGLNTAAPYGMGTAPGNVSRAPTNTTGTFGASSLSNFDTGLRNDTSYYSVGRR